MTINISNSGSPKHEEDKKLLLRDDDHDKNNKNNQDLVEEACCNFIVKKMKNQMSNSSKNYHFSVLRKEIIVLAFSTARIAANAEYQLHTWLLISLLLFCSLVEACILIPASCEEEKTVAEKMKKNNMRKKSNTSSRGQRGTSRRRNSSTTRATSTTPRSTTTSAAFSLSPSIKNKQEQEADLSNSMNHGTAPFCYLRKEQVANNSKIPRLCSHGSTVGSVLLPLLFGSLLYSDPDLETKLFSRKTAKESFWICMVCSVTASLFFVLNAVMKNNLRNAHCVFGLTLASITCCFKYNDMFEQTVTSETVLTMGEVGILALFFHVCLHVCLWTLPHTFSLGEGIIATELCVLLTHVAKIVFLTKSVELTKLKYIILIGLAAPIFITAYVLILNRFFEQNNNNKTTSLFMIATSMVFVIVMFLAMNYWIDENPFFYIFNYIQNPLNGDLIKVFLYWAVVASISFVIFHFCLPEMRLILLRKYFHLVATILFAPPILLYWKFMSLAFAVAFAIFILLEAFRFAKIYPFHPFLSNAIKGFIDSRDKGFVLTHTYLLLGCAIPVWYAYFIHQGIYSAVSLLIAISGVSVTGLGDAAAVVFGVKYGKRRWSTNSKKTLEGSFGLFVTTFISQIFFLYVMGFHEMSMESWIKLAIADMCAAVLEAVTEQIDNLILPLYLCGMLQLV